MIDGKTSLYAAFCALDTQFCGKGKRRIYTKKQRGGIGAKSGGKMAESEKILSSEDIGQELGLSARQVERMKTIRTHLPEEDEQLLLEGHMSLQEAHKISLLQRDAIKLAKGTKPMSKGSLASVLKSFIDTPRSQMGKNRPWNTQEAQFMREIIECLVDGKWINEMEELTLKSSVMYSQRPVFGGALNVRKGVCHV